MYRERRLPAERPLAANVAGLWRNGEQGVWYDSSDLSTMFQGAAGTLPVYAPGQGQVDPPVGLLLDKRPGLVRGPELLMNGDFAAGNASWGVAGADATHVVDFTGGACRYRSDTTSPVLTVSQGSLSIVAGRWYELTIVVSSWVSGGIKTDSFSGAAAGGLALASSAGTFRAIGLATSTTSVFSFLRNAANTDLTIDSISVRELPGNHAYQTTTTSRPTLSARYNQLTKSQDFSDAAVWVTQSSGTGSAPVRTKDYAAAPDGSMTATLLQMALNGGSTASDRSGVAQTVSGTTTGAGYGCAIWLKAASASSVGKTVLLRHMAGTNYLPCVLTAEWKAFGRVEAAGTTYGVVMLELRGASGGASDSVDMLVWGADLRPANDGVGLPPYQRVVDANTYDTAGFPLYLRFDGVDDSLLTADIDFSTVSRAIAVSAIRKLSDASRGIVFELGGTGYSSPGSFNQEIMWFSANVSTSYSGATGNTTSTYPCIAPFSAVMSSAWNLSAPLQTFRVNGVLRSTSTAAVGGGMFQKAPLFIGRRNNASVPFNGRLYSLLIRSAATPDATIAKVERYMNQNARAY